MLAIFVYFWSITLPEERGRIAGRIGLFSLPLYFLVDYLLAPSLDFSMIVTLGVLLSLGPILTVFLRPEKVVRVSENNEMVNYPETRTILLYSIPWILFSLINSTIAKSTSLSVLEQTPASFYFSLTIIQGIGVIFGAICGGTIADYFGRRLSLAFGLTLYGMSSALAGLASGNVILISVYFSNGLSWGVLMIMYTFVIWGDLANKENCAKLYSIGLITFYLTMGIGLLLPVMIVPLVVSALTVCLLVFLANVPLILAKELLPSDIREKIKLKLHMKAVKKLSEKPQNQR